MLQQQLHNNVISVRSQLAADVIARINVKVYIRRVEKPCKETVDRRREGTEREGSYNWGDLGKKKNVAAPVT